MWYVHSAPVTLPESEPEPEVAPRAEEYEVIDDQRFIDNIEPDPEETFEATGALGINWNGHRANFLSRLSDEGGQPAVQSPSMNMHAVGLIDGLSKFYGELARLSMCEDQPVSRLDEFSDLIGNAGLFLASAGIDSFQSEQFCEESIDYFEIQQVQVLSSESANFCSPVPDADRVVCDKVLPSETIQGHGDLGSETGEYWMLGSRRQWGSTNAIAQHHAGDQLIALPASLLLTALVALELRE